MTPSSSIDLIIFDCDGVLVDSEEIAYRVFAQCVSALGVPMDAAGAREALHGAKLAECILELENRIGRKVPESFVPAYRQGCELAFQTELKLVDGVEEALDALPYRNCVATSGPPEKVRMTLGLTGLLPRFEGRIFSAYEVGIWKPDPGLFLHAARAMEAEPHRCLVVEDSLVGVRGGVAAGMRVLGYGHGAHARKLEDAGAQVFEDMRALPALVRALASRDTFPVSR